MLRRSHDEPSDNLGSTNSIENSFTSDTSTKMTETQRGQRLLLNNAYYFGIFPAYVDQNTFRVNHVTSRSKLVAYYIVQTGLAVNRAVILFGYCNALAHNRVEVSSAIGLIQSSNAAVLLFTGLLHLHSGWKSYELVALINTYDSYFDKFKALEVIPDLYGKLLKMYFFGCVTLGVGGMLVLYWFKCEVNYYQRVFHVCNAEIADEKMIAWEHESIPKMILFSIMHFVVTMEQYASTYPYFAFVIPAIFSYLKIESALLDVEPGSYFHCHEKWMSHYRSLLLMVNQLNGWAQDVLMPVHIAGVLLLIVMLNYMVIQSINAQILSGVIQALVNCIFIAYVALLFGRTYKILNVSEAILSQKKKMQNQSKVMQLEVRSLQLIKIKIGSMFTLDSDVRMMVYAVIFDQTVNILLLK